MNQKIKAILIAAMLVVTVLIAAGCSQQPSPYQVNDTENFTVSVKYDANGGFFTTNTSVIVDSYDISGLQADGDGNVSLALVAPEDKAMRGDGNAFKASNPGHFLVGWYAQRSGEEGSYTYSQKWDFANDRQKVAANGTYSSAEPVLTLYAVWAPMFEIEFYDRATGQLIGEPMVFDPTEGKEILVPHLDEETGAMEMYNFPKKEDSTFTAAYYDAEGIQAVDTPAVVHTGVIDETTGTVTGNSMKLYVDWMDGEWFQISNVDQFLDNASVSGNYIILSDLDFTGKIWPTVLMHGNFSGSIQGNGHTFTGITLEQTNNNKQNTGIFGSLTDSASITELTIDGASLTIKGGTRMTGASFGLLAGTISNQAELTGLTIVNSQLLVDANAYFGTQDYVIGLLCGIGKPEIDASGITCGLTGEGMWQGVIVEDGLVTVTDTEPLQPAETVPEETVSEEATA